MAIQTQGTSGGFSLTPQSRWGWLSVGLAVALFLFVALFLPFNNPSQGGSALGQILFYLAAISGTGSSVIGITAVIWRKERSLLVFLSMLIGLSVTVFWVGALIGVLTGSH